MSQPILQKDRAKDWTFCTEVSIFFDIHVAQLAVGDLLAKSLLNSNPLTINLIGAGKKNAKRARLSHDRHARFAVL